MKGQSIPSERDTAGVDPEVTVTVDPANSKRLNEDDQEVINHLAVDIDREVDLGRETWRSRVSIVVNIDDIDHLVMDTIIDESFMLSIVKNIN